MRPRSELWAIRHADYFHSPAWQKLFHYIKAERDAGKTILPAERNIFRVLDTLQPVYTKVVIVGQDPYPQPEYATGLAFSVPCFVDKLPMSLKNIFRSIKIDLGIDNTNGDLSYWVQQGVFLLNSVLTVEAGKPGSHSNIGWEQLTDDIIQRLGREDLPRVFMLWGNKAREKKRLIDTSKHLVLEASHPSPLSAHRGFFWCRHFSQCNEYLEKQGFEAIDWRT